MTVVRDHRPQSVIQHAGRSYFPIAFIARLPFAMMTVGVLTLVVAARGSLALGGATSAAVGIGVVVAGPMVGHLVDTHGQRRVLVPLGVANGVLLALFPLLAYSPLPDAVLLLISPVVGITGPQTAALSRTRVIALISAHLPAARRPRAYSRAMAYESAADETAFVIGPFLVGILAAALAPWAPLATAAVLSLVFVSAFALHPTGRLTAAPEHPETIAPLTALLRGRILVLVVAIFGIGLFFGSTLTSLTALTAARGDAADGAVLYGVLGVGSAVLALASGLLPARFALGHRLVLFALLLTGTAVLYAAGGSSAALPVILCLMGVAVGPALVTLFSLAGERSPRGRSASTMTLMVSALALAQALASAVVGVVAENAGVGAALAAPTVAAAVVLAMALVNLARSPRYASLSS